MIQQSIELVSLELKKKWGNPEIDEVLPPPLDENKQNHSDQVDYWQGSPFEVLFAAQRLGIKLAKDEDDSDDEDEHAGNVTPRSRGVPEMAVVYEQG